METTDLSGSFAARRERIVDAAARLFAEAPYGDVHMDAIAAEARVAKPTLYRYFPTKEVLFVEALERTLGDLRAEIESIRRAEAPADERLRRVVALILERIGRLTPAIQAAEQASIASAAQSRRVLRQGFRSLRAAIGGIVADGAREGSFGKVDPDLASLVVIGGARMAAHAQAGAAELAASIADLFIDGLRGRQESPRPSVPSKSGVFA